MTSISVSSFSPNPLPSFSVARTSPGKKFDLCLPTGSRSGRRKKTLQVLCRTAREDWLQKLPDKKKPLYSHSLPCIEAWLAKLGFYPSRDDRALWFVEKPDWHAQLSLDVTDLYIRYLKSGPGNLEKDVERRFSYALSREDIENAILGGP